MELKDKYKKVPRTTVIGGVCVGIGSDLIDKHGRKVKKATTAQMKIIQKMFPNMFEPSKIKPNKEATEEKDQEK